MAGRRTKFDPKTVAAIVDAVSVGATYTDAAKAARLVPQTLVNWMTEGRKAREALENGETLDARARAKLDFLEQVEAAEAQVAIDMQTIVYNQATSNPDYAKWWLERRRREEFGPVVRNEVSGPDGSAMKIVIQYADDASR